MTRTAIAPHLAGRMLPGIFTDYVGRRARFPGDPWPSLIPGPCQYWMHSTGCDAGLFWSGPRHIVRKSAAAERAQMELCL